MTEIMQIKGANRNDFCEIFYPAEVRSLASIFGILLTAADNVVPAIAIPPMSLLCPYDVPFMSL